MPGRHLLDFLGFAPIAIPSVVLGATFFWFYLLVPLPIIGTLTIIGLAYLTKYMPVALRFVSASMMQIHSELDEAAQVAGVLVGAQFLQGDAAAAASPGCWRPGSGLWCTPIANSPSR